MLATPFYKGQGLGNQLANYVTVRSIALNKGYNFGVQFPENFKGKDFLNLDMGKPVLNGVTNVEGQAPEKLPDGFTSYYREEMIGHGDYDPKIALIGDNTLIHGNLQGIEYFKHRKEEIREWLKVAPLEMGENTCVINFRGGEYKYVKDFFLPQSYWHQAIDIMLRERPDMTFIVHTDDADEAHKFFPNYAIVQNMELNWRSIRYAKYLILSNSSFAILPAWLNENANKVIAPWGFGRFNTGEWLLSQNYVPEWTWIDKDGVCR